MCVSKETQTRPCDGDWGAPLICEGETYNGSYGKVLVGIARGGETNCGTNKPYVYVAVSYYLDFLIGYPATTTSPRTTTEGIMKKISIIVSWPELFHAHNCFMF